MKSSLNIANFILAKDEYTRDKFIELGCHFVCNQDGYFLLTNELNTTEFQSMKFDNNMKFSVTNMMHF